MHKWSKNTQECILGSLTPKGATLKKGEGEKENVVGLLWRISDS